MTATKRVLLTAFEPFGGEAKNASELALERVSLRDDIALHKRVLPCVFGEALTALEAAITETSPSLVICTGQAGGSNEVAIEQVAINLSDARIPDNKGKTPRAERTYEHHQNALFSTLPIDKIVSALKTESLPAKRSLSAGAFVCNHVFFGLMAMLETKPGVLGGFVHLPNSDEQELKRGTPSWPTKELARALEVIVTTCIG